MNLLLIVPCRRRDEREFFDMQLSNIVNCMDHQDFARRLGKRRKRLHALPG